MRIIAPVGMGILALLVGRGTSDVTSPPSRRGDRPPATIKFTDRMPNLSEAEMKEWGTPRCGYFTNRVLPADDPAAANAGAFICTQPKGTAAYFYRGRAHQRTITFHGIRSSAAGDYFYVFTEESRAREKTRWAFEARPAREDRCAVYHQEGEGEVKFFQTATRAGLAP